MRFAPGLLALALAGVGGSALANDTMAALGTGGLVFLTTPDIEMTSEELAISMDEVRVKYTFTNTSDADVDALVAFPMPDIEGSPDFMVAVPGQSLDTLFGFTTTFDGEAIDGTLHAYAFAAGIDYSERLKALGIPLAPHDPDALTAIAALSDEEKAELLHDGLVVPMEYDQGQGWKTDYYPVWTLKTTYAWEAHFPARTTVNVEHAYAPSLGGTVATTFFGEADAEYDPMATYTKKYCMDKGFIASVRKSMTADDPYSAPYQERWLSYVLTTGANWGGPIRDFRLIIDKGDARNLVSFCGEGVKKTGPTTFEMRATDYWPRKDLDILILVRNPE